MHRHLGYASAIAAATTLIALGTSVAAPAAYDAATKRGCDADQIELGGREYVFHKHHMSCERAKRYAHHVYNSNGNWEPRNFNCRSGSNFNQGAFCQKRVGQNESFGWHPFD